MKRRSFLFRAAGLAAAVGGGLWLRDHLLWKAPLVDFTAGDSGWLNFAVAQTRVPTLKVEVAGRTLTALVDTGAQYSVIDQVLVTELGLGQGVDMPLVAYGVGGDAQTGKGVTLDLKLGRLQVPDLRTAVLDLGPLASSEGLGAPLVLGQDLLGQVILELDTKGQRLRLLDPASYTADRAMVQVEVERRGTALTLPITVEGAAVEAVIDTGFSSLLALSEATAKGAGLLDGRSETASSSIVLGGMAPARLIEVQSLSFAGEILSGAEVNVYADSPLPNYPQALLGMAAFEGRRVALDLGRGRLFMTRQMDLTIG